MSRQDGKWDWNELTEEQKDALSLEDLGWYVRNNPDCTCGHPKSDHKPSSFGTLKCTHCGCFGTYAMRVGAAESWERDMGIGASDEA